jgi:hypothetical protein
VQRFLVAIALLVISCSAAKQADAPVTTSPVVAPPGGIGGIATTRWTFETALLKPPDPNTYSDVVIDAQPLADGGWIVIHAPVVRPRFNCDPTSYGCGFVRGPIGYLERLDPTGRVVAREHGAEPFGLTRIHVFESLNVVVGEGPQVLNGTLHAFRLDTLDGIASELTQGCVVDGSRCYSLRPDFASGTTTVEERDPRDLRLVQAWTVPVAPSPSGSLALFPKENLLAWRAATDTPPFWRAAALDAARPLAIPWLARLQSACEVIRVAEDRAFVTFGPADCRGDSGWHGEIIEVSSGRVIRVVQPDDGISGNALADHAFVQIAESGIVVDPQTGSDGPRTDGRPLSVEWDRGLAVFALADGGAAVLRRAPGTAARHDLAFQVTASATCDAYERPRVMAALPATVTCSGLASAVGAARILITPGKAYHAASGVDVRRVAIDPNTRTIEVTYAPEASRRSVTEPAATTVIELTEPPSAGDWLVRLSISGGPAATAFVVGF